jgi:hypothetical protein
LNDIEEAWSDIERAERLIAPLEETPTIDPVDSYPVMIQKGGNVVDSNTIGKRLEASVGAE